MSDRFTVKLQCKPSNQKFWKHVGFTPTRKGEEGVYEASAGYMHMSVSLRSLKGYPKQALHEKSAPRVSSEEELEKVTLNTKASPKPNPNPNPNPNPKP